MAAKKTASKKKPGPQCGCINALTKLLDKEYPGVMIDAAFSIHGSVMRIPLTKTSGAPRGTKVPIMIVNNCPLCGKKYIK